MPILLAIIALLVPYPSAAEGSAAEDVESWIIEARGIAFKFAKSLKPQLKNAMQSGGPVHAIIVCAEQDLC